MSNTTTDFINAVYEELTKLLNLGSEGNPSIVMQMAWPGYALSPTDFRRSDAPNGPYDVEAAREATSQLANIAPLFSRARFENSGFEIDDLYEIVLSSAIPVGATPETVGANPIYRLFSDAQYELSQAKRGSPDDPNVFYYPANATPNNWYDESATANWTSVSINSSQVKPASSSSSALVKSGLLDQVTPSVWRMKPTVKNAIDLKKDLFAKNPLLTKARVPAVSPMSPMSPVAPVSPTHTLNPTVMKRTLQPAVMPGGLPKVGPMVTPDLFSHKIVPTSRLKAGGIDPSRVDLLKRDLGCADLLQRVVVRSVLDKALPSKPPSPQTDGFSITFKFCRVTLDRPWLKLALLSTPNWWMFDTPVGTYSSGDSTTNAGLFPFLTTSFIAIRDLKITANWSAEDRANLTSAASFGCFDLQDASVNNDTIEVKGLQVIAFVSKLMPRLPPQAPPVA